MYICVTEVDSKTKILCTKEPQRTGPSMPNIAGLKLDWTDSSTWPVELDTDGTYLRAPRYYGTCDDNANINIEGVLEVLSKEEYFERKTQEFEARKPFNSWLWDEANTEWVPPKQLPNDSIAKGGTIRYKWNEQTVDWIAIPPFKV